MKLLSAIVCASALASNILLAASGWAILCIEKASGQQCDVSASGKSPLLERCCSVENAQNLASETYPFDCDHCTDFAVDESDQELWSSAERGGLKVTAVEDWTFADYTLVQRTKIMLRTMPTRGPPLCCGSSWHYAETIQLQI
jgi:hypothetical protein